MYINVFVIRDIIVCKISWSIILNFIPYLGIRFLWAILVCVKHGHRLIQSIKGIYLINELKYLISAEGLC